MLTQSENAQAEVSLNIQTLHCSYKIFWDKNDENTKGKRQLWIDDGSDVPSHPSIFVEEPVSQWGVEHWSLWLSPFKAAQFANTRADGMIGQASMERRTGQKVTYKARCPNARADYMVAKSSMDDRTDQKVTDMARFPDSRADYMVGQTLIDGKTGRKVTDPFL